MQVFLFFFEEIVFFLLFLCFFALFVYLYSFELFVKMGLTVEYKKADHNTIYAYGLLCRDEAIRTPDPYVPNVVRYQLRYIPL